IQQYESKVADSGIQPSELGIDATAAAARRIGTPYRESGQEIGSAISSVGDQASDYWAHREISKGAAEFSTFMAKTTQDWNQVAQNADPNDPSVAAKFRSSMEDKLQEF